MSEEIWVKVLERAVADATGAVAPVHTVKGRLKDREDSIQGQAIAWIYSNELEEFIQMYGVPVEASEVRKRVEKCLNEGVKVPYRG